MTEPDSAPENPQQIDHCCDLFEKHWGTDKAFSIEDVLIRLPAAQHGAYLKALLPVEIELRGQNPQSAHELHQRFPQLVDVVNEVLSTPPPEDSLATPAAPNSETIAPQDQNGDEHSVPASGALRIPRQLGRYRIVRKLGHGAMGSVFLAHDEQLDRQVALKIPRGDMQRNKELRLRFEREARAAASLDHPNICRIHDIGEFEGIHYICMGYVEGFPLTRYAIAESGLTEQRIAALILKLARALASAHEAGFIHRDLKPANVMMDYNEEPVILDFGLARRIDRNQDTRVTQTGTNVGSPAYMSPEQVEGDQKKIGLATDVYSLGVMLYELLTGRLPFDGSVASVMGQIMVKDPDKPSDYRKDLSVRLERICQRMMAKKIADRFPSMHAVAAAIQEYLDKYSTAATVIAVAEPNLDEQQAGDERRRQIERLVQAGDYAQAEALLIRLSRETESGFSAAAAWAASELPKLRKTRQEVRAGRQEMFNTAVRFLKSHDYEQAVQLLEEYPYDLRTPRMQELLERAESQAAEVKRLKREIKAARTRGDNAALLELTAALLKLKPGDRRAKQLREELTRKVEGPISRVLGKRSPRFVDNLGPMLQWVTLLSGVMMICCYPAYQWASNFLNSENQKQAIGAIATINEGSLSGTVSETSSVDEATSANSTEAPESPSSPDPQLASATETDSAEWIDLLSQNLAANWEMYSGAEIGETWTLDSGVLTFHSANGVRGSGNDLATRQGFSDFELEFDWKIGKGGNAGVFYLAETGFEDPAQSGPEYQILDNDGHRNGRSVKTAAGSVFGIAAATNAQTKPLGAWNSARIVRTGKQIEHWLNGVKVAEAEIDSDQWLKSVAEMKMTRNRPNFAKAASGRIVLQDYGRDVAFRNFRIRRLDTPAKNVASVEVAPVDGVPPLADLFPDLRTRLKLSHSRTFDKTRPQPLNRPSEGGGVLSITSHTGIRGWNVASIETAQVMRARLRVRNHATGKAGICITQKDNQNGYTIWISGDREVTVAPSFFAKNRPDIIRTVASNLNFVNGVGEWNVLTCFVMQNQFKVFVNGQHVTSIPASAYSVDGGTIAFANQVKDKNTIVELDGLQVYDVITNDN